jgi:hypothetical protein
MDLLRVQKDKWMNVLSSLVINKEERIRIGLQEEKRLLTGILWTHGKRNTSGGLIIIKKINKPYTGRKYSIQK